MNNIIPYTCNDDIHTSTFQLHVCGCIGAGVQMHVNISTRYKCQFAGVWVKTSTLLQRHRCRCVDVGDNNYACTAVCMQVVDALIAKRKLHGINLRCSCAELAAGEPLVSPSRAERLSIAQTCAHVALEASVCKS